MVDLTGHETGNGKTLENPAHTTTPLNTSPACAPYYQFPSLTLGTAKTVEQKISATHKTIGPEAGLLLAALRQAEKSLKNPFLSGKGRSRNGLLSLLIKDPRQKLSD